MSFLEKPLAAKPVGSEDERVIVEELWKPYLCRAKSKNGSSPHKAYLLHHYNNLCRRACTGTHQVSTFTHRQLLQVCHALQAPGSTQSQVLANLTSSTPEGSRLVRLAGAILLPMEISDIGGMGSSKPTEWNSNQSLLDLFDLNMSVNVPTVTFSHTTLPVSAQLSTKFNARNFDYIAGFDIRWTSVLSDHLKVVEIDDKIRLYLFHQTWFLERHLELQSPLIPRDLVTETFDTLALLIPRRDASVRKWFSKLQEKYKLDAGAGSRDNLPLERRSLDNFKHWRSRLLIIKDLYDAQEPASPLRAWRDKRRPVQWWTFWIAVLVLVLTIVFGLIQSITGILQVSYCSH